MKRLMNYYTPVKRKNVAIAFLLVLFFGWLGGLYVRGRFALLYLATNFAYLAFAFVALNAWAIMWSSLPANEYAYFVENFTGFLVFLAFAIHVAAAIFAGALANRSQQVTSTSTPPDAATVVQEGSEVADGYNRDQ